MADELFHDVAQPSARLTAQRPFTVLVSIVAHTVAILTAIIVPVLATNNDLLPAKAALATFIVRPPMPPSPPPPRMPGRTEPLEKTVAPVPVQAPDTIVAEVPVGSSSDLLAGIEHSHGIVEGGEIALTPPPAQSPPAVVPQTVVRPGGQIKPPRKITDVPPAYPSIARMAGVQGTVILEATIDSAGTVQDVRVLRSIPLLDASAIEAVRQWKYTPTLLNGNPVTVVMTVTVNFKLR